MPVPETNCARGSTLASNNVLGAIGLKPSKLNAWPSIAAQVRLRLRRFWSDQVIVSVDPSGLSVGTPSMLPGTSESSMANPVGSGPVDGMR